MSNLNAFDSNYFNSVYGGNGGSILIYLTQITDFLNNQFLNSLSNNNNGGSIKVQNSTILSNFFNNSFLNSSSTLDGGALYSIYSTYNNIS